jgi:hypothetical protein
MAMTKAEMQLHRESYDALIAKARQARERGAYSELVANAVTSLEHVDGMMQYARKYEAKEFESIEGIDFVLGYAPFIFDSHSLAHVGAVLKAQRRIERDTSVDLAARLTQSHSMMRLFHRLWDHLERNKECQDGDILAALGGSDEQWRVIIAGSIELGLIRRSPGRPSCLSLCTRMDETVFGKCPACGLVGKSAKSNFLQEHHCPRCQSMVGFVVLEGAPT